MLSNKVVNNSLKRKITEHLPISPSGNKMFQSETNRIYCPIHASLGHQTPDHAKWSGGSTCHICGNTILRDSLMIASTMSALGTVTRSRTALAVFTATIVLGGGIGEASAKGRHHYGYHHHHHGYRHHEARA